MLASRNTRPTLQTAYQGDISSSEVVQAPKIPSYIYEAVKYPVTVLAVDSEEGKIQALGFQ